MVLIVQLFGNYYFGLLELLRYSLVMLRLWILGLILVASTSSKSKVTSYSKLFKIKLSLNQWRVWSLKPPHLHTLHFILTQLVCLHSNYRQVGFHGFTVNAAPNTMTGHDRGLNEIAKASMQIWMGVRINSKFQWCLHKVVPSSKQSLTWIWFKLTPICYL